MEKLKKHMDVISREAAKVFTDYPQVSTIIVDTDGEFVNVHIEIDDLNEEGGNNE